MMCSVSVAVQGLSLGRSTPKIADLYGGSREWGGWEFVRSLRVSCGGWCGVSNRRRGKQLYLVHLDGPVDRL